MSNQYVSLNEAAQLLGMDERKVFELIKYGFLSAREENRKTFVPKEDLNVYARRFNIKLQEIKKSRFKTAKRDFSIEAAAEIIGNKKEVHKLIQAGSLKAGFVKGEYVVHGQSLYDYIGGVE